MTSVRGRPVPHAEILDDLLSKFLGDSYSNNALFDFILGEPNQKDANLSGLAGDNLDINVLDAHSVRRIIDFAKKKYETGIAAEENSRRSFWARIEGYYYVSPRNEAFEWHPYIVNKTIDLMKQTIYMTHEKVNFTRTHRKPYVHEVGYQVAILYGAASAMLGKMESLLAQMRNLIPRTHFVWFLILYEKILAVNIDISDTVERLFTVHESYDRMYGSRVTGKELNVTSEDLKKLLQDPLAAEQFLHKHNINFN